MAPAALSSSLICPETSSLIRALDPLRRPMFSSRFPVTSLTLVFGMLLVGVLVVGMRFLGMARRNNCPEDVLHSSTNGYSWVRLKDQLGSAFQPQLAGDC